MLNNLRLLGFRPADLDAVVISHGHYDHTGGLGHILQAAGKPLPVFIHPAAFKARFSLAGGDAAPIGIPTTKERLSAWGAEWRLADGPVEVAGGLWLSGEVPRVAPYWRGDARLVTKPDRDTARDEIEDDLSLFLVRGEKLVVISGCAHAGMINIIRHGLAVTGAKKLAGWIGGTHLGPATREEQEQAISDLAALEPEFVAANHCTALPMIIRLSNLFGSRYKPAFVGSIIEC